MKKETFCDDFQTLWFRDCLVDNSLFFTGVGLFSKVSISVSPDDLSSLNGFLQRSIECASAGLGVRRMMRPFDILKTKCRLKLLQVKSDTRTAIFF